MTERSDRRAPAARAGASCSETTLSGQVLVAGKAIAPTVVLTQPLSFWGGYDATRGVIIDPRHPQFGLSVAGTIVIMTHAKGSSSSSSVLAEAIRKGTGPRGIILRERDLIISIGAIVAWELYGQAVPVVALDERQFQTACRLQGSVRIEAEDAAAKARIAEAD